MILTGFDCNDCKHQRENIDGWRCACDAFQEGIPMEHFYGNPSELEECNNGIKFEKREETMGSGTKRFYKNDPKDKIYWVDTSDRVGEWLFSFDKQTIFNMFADYPYKLTEEQKKIFDEENPYWKDFFSDRQ